MNGSRDGRPGPARRVLNPAQPDPLLHYEYDRGSNYEEDTRLTIALSALVPEAALHSPDHRFFQVTHLITEYAWVAIHHDLTAVAGALAAGDLTRARRQLTRACGTAAIPVVAVRNLMTSLPQTGLLRMRQLFPPNTTGLDSPGGRNLRRACRAVWTAFETHLNEAGHTLPALVEAAATDAASPGTAPAADVMLAMQRLDAAVMEWKQVHLSMVWMLIGGQPFAAEDDIAQEGPSSLRGRPIGDLERMAMRPMFPRLWQLSTETFHRTVNPEEFHD